MDSPKATKLIRNHLERWPWRVEGSDAEVASRSERIYFRLAIACVLLAILFTVFAIHLRRWGIMLMVASLFTCATSFAIVHRPFGQILKLLPSRKT